LVFRLDHGGEVDADGNCLFTAARTAAAAKADARELRHRAVRRFAEVYAAAGEDDKAAVDAAVRHLYAPDLKAGWGVHVVQEMKVLVPKAQRDALDAAIQELVDLGIQRYHDSRICPCSLLTACSNLLFDFLAGSCARARSSVAGRREDKDGGNWESSFGVAVGEGRFWVRDPLPVRDSNAWNRSRVCVFPLETV